MERGAIPSDQIEVVEHTADWALRIRGHSLGQLFQLAALGMSALLVEQELASPCDIRRQVELEAYDVETLLVDWLSELLFWVETEQIVPCSVAIEEISPTHLLAQVYLALAPELEKHIKAVTYHELAIKQTAQGFEVTIVFDV